MLYTPSIHFLFPTLKEGMLSRDFPQSHHHCIRFSVALPRGASFAIHVEEALLPSAPPRLSSDEAACNISFCSICARPKEEKHINNMKQDEFLKLCRTPSLELFPSQAHPPQSLAETNRRKPWKQPWLRCPQRGFSVREDHFRGRKVGLNKKVLQ